MREIPLSIVEVTNVWNRAICALIIIRSPQIKISPTLEYWGSPKIVTMKFSKMKGEGRERVSLPKNLKILD